MKFLKFLAQIPAGFIFAVGLAMIPLSPIFIAMFYGWATTPSIPSNPIICHTSHNGYVYFFGSSTHIIASYHYASLKQCSYEWPSQTYEGTTQQFINSATIIILPTGQKILFSGSEQYYVTKVPFHLCKGGQFTSKPC